MNGRSATLQGLINAVENGSSVPVRPEMIAAMLRGEGGEPAHLRALFGDCSLRLLDAAAAAHGIAPATLLAAYAAARRDVAAANPELDALLEEEADREPG